MQGDALMWWPFKKSQKADAQKPQFMWKEDFTDCVALKYLPEYSVCKCKNNYQCRFVAMFSGLVLCCNPEHKSFIPEDSEPYDPYEGSFF